MSQKQDRSLDGYQEQYPATVQVIPTEVHPSFTGCEQSLDRSQQKYSAFVEVISGDNSFSTEQQSLEGPQQEYTSLIRVTGAISLPLEDNQLLEELENPQNGTKYLLLSC